MSFTKNPFLFGQTVENTCFFDRRDEQALLKSSFEAGQNTILIAPRRYGKSSLIRKVIKDLKPRTFFCAYVDLFRANTLQKFNDILSQALAQATHTPLKQFGRFIKEWAPRLTPRVIIRGDELPEVDFEFARPSEKGQAVLGDLLGILPKMVKRGGKKGVIVFDEFQEILQFGDVSLLKEIRAIIQNHQDIAYCFAGSKQHLISEIFINAESPFFQFGKLITLDKLPRDDFFSFIVDNLKRFHIKNVQDLAGRILDFTSCHPYYTQMFCSYLWDIAQQGRQPTFESAMEVILKNQSYAYVAFWDRFTARQRNVLIALTHDPSASLHTADAILHWDLGSSATVTKVIRSLHKDGFIETGEGGRDQIADPFFARWLRQI